MSALLTSYIIMKGVNLMEIREKMFDPPQKSTEMPKIFHLLEKMPNAMQRSFFRANLKGIRDAMGGESLDISTRLIAVADKKIKGYGDQIVIRIFTPEGDIKRPVMVFFHGGGWIGGSLKTVDNYCKAYADQLDSVVVSVDYHLAPEYPYPHGLRDCYEACLWTAAHADELNIDTDHLTVSGDSAGGNYAAAISLMARDRKDLKIRYQILLYPAVTFKRLDANGKEDTSPMNMVMKEWYIGKNGDAADPYVSPILAKDLSNLPDCLIAFCELDFLTQEDMDYAAALEKAGNRVLPLYYRNTPHAFIDNIGNMPQVQDLLNEIKAFMG